MKKIFIAFIAVFAFTAIPHKAVAQNENLWKTLSKITFRKEYDEMLGFKIDVPVFSEDILKLEGKEVTVRGYIIPVEGYQQQGYFVFSAYPYNLCYFCGGAGPETVMEVFTKEGTTVKYTAKPITIKGKLVLNSKDVNKLMYLLEDAVLVEK